MRVAEFLDTYPIDSSVPWTGDSVYDAARRQSHVIGEATINAIQGLPINSAQEKASDIAAIAATDAQLTERVNAELNNAGTEYAHFGGAVLGALLRPQLDMVAASNKVKIDFAKTGMVTTTNLTLGALRLVAPYEKLRQNGVLTHAIMSSRRRSLVNGVVNEVEAAMALLYAAQAVKDERKLAILAAPPHAEWYPPRESGSNRHADLLVVDISNPEDKKVACVQVKSLADIITSKKYDKDKVALLCGQMDLGNWTQDNDGRHSWPGRMVLHRAGEIFLNEKNLHRMIIKGYISQGAAVKKRHEYKELLKNIKHRNVNYKEIHNRIWPRIAAALDS